MPRKFDLKKLQEILAQRGGKPRNQISNSTTKVLWECSKGHIWNATPSKIIAGKWCPICGRSHATQLRWLSIEEMQEIAQKRNGRCLSTSYKSAKSKLLWQCSEGHQWEANPNSIKRGSWCPACSKIKSAALQHLSRLSIQEMQNIAKDRGGFCLSKEYVDSHRKLIWQCSEGHRWLASPTHIKSGQWCRKCAAKRNAQQQKLGIEEMQQIAKERGGRCLSISYETARSKVLWECGEGHHWEAAPYSIKNGTWCPECKIGFGERVCRELFKQLFDDSFPRGYPRWLVNKNGNQLELDGFCEKLKLAFEHQGQQHYGLSTPFIKTASRLGLIKENDHIKKILCKERGISLIEIPEIGTLVKIDDLKDFVKTKCNELNYPIPPAFHEKKINFNHAYFTSFLASLNSLARNRGGKCLSKVFKGNDEPLEWQCSEGHTWSATPHNVKKGTWCPVCAGMKRLTLEEMQKLAEEKGGRCLSTVYVNAYAKLGWECKKGHKWQAAPTNIKRGSWCPICGKERSSNKQRLTIEIMGMLAKERGGHCLSTNYVKSNIKLEWECKEGHRWKTTPDSIRDGKWCPICGRENASEKKRLSIYEMDAFAALKGGKCLSKTYRNNRTKLLWECAEGHKWEAIPVSIKRGSWCPFCAKKRILEFQKSRRSSISEMQAIAQRRGGRCLSMEYVNAFSNLDWKCEKGHRWQAAPAYIKSRTWCPKCGKNRAADNQRHAIESMRELARKRNGRCLSPIYSNSKSNLLWECSNGHRWEAKPQKIAQGTWCPTCAGNTKREISDMILLARERGGACLSNIYRNSSSKLQRFKSLVISVPDFLDKGLIG